MIQTRDLARIARALASGSIDGGGRIGRPRETDLRGAVGKIYYALFHILARTCADMVVGSTVTDQNREAWRQTYRALNHGYARRQCGRLKMMEQFPIEIRRFGEMFVEMQRLRHIADYDPYPAEYYKRGEILKQIEEAQRVINNFLSLPAANRRSFAVYVLLPTRSD